MAVGTMPLPLPFAVQLHAKRRYVQGRSLFGSNVNSERLEAMKKAIKTPDNQLATTSYSAINSVIDEISRLNALVERLSFEKSRAEALARLAEKKVPYPLVAATYQTNGSWNKIGSDWKWRYAVSHDIAVTQFTRFISEDREIVEIPTEILSRLAKLEGPALDFIVNWIDRMNHPD